MEKNSDGYTVCGVGNDKLGCDHSICENCFCKVCYTELSENCDCLG